MQAELSCKTSDLQKVQQNQNDIYFDGFRAREDKEQQEKIKNAQIVRNNFVKRVISHPSFHNVTFKDAERMLRNMEPVSNLFFFVKFNILYFLKRAKLLLDHLQKL